jgi:hypothetical protein
MGERNSIIKEPFENCVEFIRDFYGEKSLKYAESLEFYAEYQINEEQYTEAQKNLEIVLEIKKNFLGENHILVCNTMEN